MNRICIMRWNGYEYVVWDEMNRICIMRWNGYEYVVWDEMNRICIMRWYQIQYSGYSEFRLTWLIITHYQKKNIPVCKVKIL